MCLNGDEEALECRLGDPLAQLFVLESPGADVRATSEKTATHREAVHGALLDGFEHLILRPTVEVRLGIPNFLSLTHRFEEGSFLGEITKRERLVVVVLPDVPAFDELDPRLLSTDCAALGVGDPVEWVRRPIVASCVHVVVVDAFDCHILHAAIT